MQVKMQAEVKGPTPEGNERRWRWSNQQSISRFDGWDWRGAETRWDWDWD